jgi:hypothetical protein
MAGFDFDQFETAGASGLDALFAREPQLMSLPKTARVRVASVQTLKPFERVSAETLVHKSNRDLWAIKKEGENFFIERLFDDNGSPLKG